MKKGVVGDMILNGCAVYIVLSTEEYDDGLWAFSGLYSVEGRSYVNQDLDFLIDDVIVSTPAGLS